MQIFLKLIYNLIALPLLFLYSKLMSLTNDKIKQREEFSESYLDIPPKKNKRVLIHASSMGEYEQVKYLVEIIRKNEPNTEIIASFFSPSGYNNLKEKKMKQLRSSNCPSRPSMTSSSTGEVGPGTNAT